jgi:hypothetical protein
MLIGIILGIIICQYDIRSGFHFTTKATDKLWDIANSFFKKTKKLK